MTSTVLFNRLPFDSQNSVGEFLNLEDLAVYSSTSKESLDAVTALCQSYQKDLPATKATYMGRLVLRLHLNNTNQSCGRFLKKVNKLARILKEPSLFFQIHLTEIHFPRNLQGLLSPKAVINVTILDALNQKIVHSTIQEHLLFVQNNSINTNTIPTDVAETPSLNQKLSILFKWFKTYGQLCHFTDTKRIYDWPKTFKIPKEWAYLELDINAIEALTHMAMEQSNLSFVRTLLDKYPPNLETLGLDENQAEITPSSFVMSFRNSFAEYYDGRLTQDPKNIEYVFLIDKILLTHPHVTLRKGNLGDILHFAAKNGNGKNVKLCFNHPAARNLTLKEIAIASDAAEESGFGRVVRIIDENTLKNPHIDAPNKMLSAILKCSAENGSRANVSLCLAHPNASNLTQEEIETARNEASENGFPHIEMLLSKHLTNNKENLVKQERTNKR